MSFKEVKQLRKEGNLEQGFQLAKQDLEANPNDIWNKRSLSWVLYDYIKLNSDSSKFKEFNTFLLQIKELELPNEETMFFDNLAYQIAKIVFSIQKKERVNYKRINIIFDKIKNFPFSKPSESYSVLLKSFLKGKEWSRFIEFADWWDFENFRPEDYKKTEIAKGKTIMSLVEQAYITYSKKLLEINTNDENRKDQINEFLPKLDLIIENHPEYQYPLYFKAKLLLSLGSSEDALSDFLPFARKKQNDFWVWELMSDFFEIEDDRKLACLCKAVSLKTPTDFLVKTREKLAAILVEKELYENAIPEIIKVIKIRKENNWLFSQDVVNWTKEPWFILENIKMDNSDFYLQHTVIAEDLIYKDIEEEVVAVEFVNKNKKMLSFVKNKTKKGYFKYSNHLKYPKVGDTIKVRFNGKGKDDFYKIYSAKTTNDSTKSEAIKQFQGNIRINPGQKFGFVENIFANPDLITNNKIENNQLVKGKAIFSFNKKKSQWGWKAFEILK